MVACGLTQILAAWFYRSWSRIDGCLAWPRYWRPDSTGLDHALMVACGLTQILAAWFYRSWSRIGGCLGLTQILAAWFYRSWSRIGGCLWLDPDTGGLILQVLITHWWLPVAWPRYWQPDSTGLDHAMMVTCGLTQILAAWFYRSWSRNDGYLWLDPDTGSLILQVLITHWWLPGLTQILEAWFYRPGLTQILTAWFYRSWSSICGCLWLDPDTGGLILQVLITHWWLPGLTQIREAWFYRPGLTQIMAAWFYRSSPHIDGCLWLHPDTGGLILQAWLDPDTGGLILQAWLDPDTGGLILQAWLDPDNGGLILQAWLDPDTGGLILQVFTTHWWLPVAWPRYWRPDSTGLDHAMMVACGLTQILAADSTGLDHALMVACGLTQILAAWFYRSWSRIDGCLWLDPDTSGLILQDVDHAMMVTCGLTQILAAWFYRSWSHIDGCLWLDTDTGGLILQVLITHWWLPVAWHRYWRPDSTGLDHALMVVYGLTQILAAGFGCSCGGGGAVGIPDHGFRSKVS